jgi:ubiquinone/menaquinone biosynthesis C-methylase UbiE
MIEDRPYLPGMGRAWLLPLYDPLTRLLGARRVHRLLLAGADLRRGLRVLEIGCGTGNLVVLAGRRHPGLRLRGLDPDPAALARAERKARRAGVPLELTRGYADRLPYPDGGFDRVLSSYMLHHLAPDERVAALREAGRVLAPGGSLHVVDLTGGGRHHGVDLPALLAEAGFAGVRRTGGGSNHFGPYAAYSVDSPPG